MKRVLVAIALAVVIPSPIVHPTASQAQPAAPQTQTPKKFSVEYREPRYLAIYQRVKARKILEELAEFLSPLKLDHDLKLQIDDDDHGSEFTVCRESDSNSYYDPNKHIVHICYNWFEMLENGASVRRYEDPKEFTVLTPGLMPGFTRGEVIVGGAVANILHELGHAIRHNLDLPRLGREEDTADQIAGYLMLQFGQDVALPMIKGSINVWHHLQAERLLARPGGGITAADQAGVHSIDLQRGLNYLCLAFGSPHSAAFKALADKWLPADRKDNCEQEYNTVKLAFDLTIKPKVDPVKLEKVKAMKILRPEDLK